VFFLAYNIAKTLFHNIGYKQMSYVLKTKQ